MEKGANESQKAQLKCKHNKKMQYICMQFPIISVYIVSIYTKYNMHITNTFSAIQN